MKTLIRYGARGAFSRSARLRWLRLCVLASAAGVLSCGGGGGGGDGGPPPPPPCSDPVCTGYAGDLNWEIGANSGPGDGVGAAGDGDGGVGVGGDFGQFRNALVVVRYPDGREFGRALTDEAAGMVTLRPGTYQGPLVMELRGTANATYYEEGKGTFVPFPEGEVIRAVIPRIERNIGITPFSEVAWRLLTEGSTAERAAATTPTADEIRAANGRALRLLNQQFPKALEVDDVTRLPFIKSPSIAANTIEIDARGRYGLVNGAFSKQAAMFNPDATAPTLAAVRHLSTDMLDGRFDGMLNGQPAVPAASRTYDVNTITGELSSALAEQTYRFGTNAAKVELPALLNFGSSRYEGYLFDAALDAQGSAFTRVSGWVIEPSPGDSLGGPALGSKNDKTIVGVPRLFGVFGNFGHGGVFLKTDASDSRSAVYALGDNVNGELGLGRAGGTLGKPEPVNLPGTLTHVAGGFSHTVVRLADGSVWAWGDNAYGQLGQGSTSPASSLTPLRVNLPRGAVSVAATNVASYALLDDGTVMSWGSNLGFGLLGNGSANGMQATPAPVRTAAGSDLNDVVQLAARDNDAVVLKRDGSVLTWGSFPADATAYTPGDPAQPYAGGRSLATAINGLPAGVPVRKVLTEQGLFVALTDDGAVYSWGVHFDMTARGSFAPFTDGILRDIDAVRVLNLPPVRDLMPGGFIGYGQRTTDRLTAMAISYRGVLWKVRGRVAERFDPANWTQQRRPIGSARPDCASCHVTLSDWPLAAPPATSGTTCTPQQNRPDVHGTPTASLIHADTAETKCVMCHNPARTTVNANFTNGWLNCTPPTNLPQRDAPVTPPPLTSTCALPPNHTFTPPGTVCASCHNSVIASTLACAQPAALPALATTATIASINGSTTNPSSSTDTTPTLGGTSSAALAQGEVIRVLRNGASAGVAAVSGTTWSFADGPLADGTYAYTVRVEAGTAFGRDSASFTAIVDNAAPQVSATIVTMTDDFGALIPPGSTTADTTPTLNITLSGPLAAGESIQVVNFGTTVVAGTATNVGASWRFAPSGALGAGSYSFQARVVDAAGNRGGLSAARTLTIDTTLPGAAIAAVGGIVPSASGAVALANTNPFTIAGTTQRALQTGQVVRIYLDGTALASVGSVGSATWSYASPSLGEGTFRFVAQVQQGTAVGASALVDVTVDATSPSQTVTVSATRSVPTTTPGITVRLVASATPGGGESLLIAKDGTTLTPTLTTCASGAYCVEFIDTSLQTGATYTYTARMRDSAGNLGPQGSGSIASYQACSPPQFHFDDPIRYTCYGCHTRSGGYVAAPRSTPTYWCTHAAGAP